MLLNKLQYWQQAGAKHLAVLIDPDDKPAEITEVYTAARMNGVELFLVGGSLLTEGRTAATVDLLKNLGAPFVVLFPGNEIQVVKGADAILFMSLISGRNPEFLIGKQVTSAPWVKKAGLEAIPTGYMLVESGKLNSALYMSNSLPLPSGKPDIAAATALAGELLGLKLFYLDAGSGADYAVPGPIIERVRQTVSGVLFVGGGIRSGVEAENAWKAGADVIVIGNGVFENPLILEEMQTVCKKMNSAKIGV
jgi:putative glycerol-1-phosphate prenyltransferase